MVRLSTHWIELVLLHHFVVGLLRDHPTILTPEVLLAGSVQLKVDADLFLTLFGVVKDVTELLIDTATVYNDIIDPHLEHTPLHRLRAYESGSLHRYRIRFGQATATAIFR